MYQIYSYKPMRGVEKHLVGVANHEAWAAAFVHGLQAHPNLKAQGILVESSDYDKPIMIFSRKNLGGLTPRDIQRQLYDAEKAIKDAQTESD